jgi:hypothetical protein|tara:strand:+ start:249 stop:470 length:222 start_codon:yes stop_codon:yes gene_type:complete
VLSLLNTSFTILNKKRSGSPLVKNYRDRVVADGGTAESLSFINELDFAKLNWKFYFRVIEDSGTIESIECVTF